MVIVIVVLPMASIGIVPLQLSLKSMVLLRQVFLPIMIRVSPSVAPFKCFMSWHVYVLEMIVPPYDPSLPGRGMGRGPAAPPWGWGKHDTVATTWHK